MEAFHVACYGNAPYIPVELHRAHNANGADTSAAYRNVDRCGGIFHSGQQKADCDALLPLHACLVAWCMHGSMLQCSSLMSTTRSFTHNVKTDDDRLSGWVPQHLLDWRFTLHNDWNAQRIVALCVACFLHVQRQRKGAWGVWL